MPHSHNTSPDADHPAAQWATESPFGPVEVDCTTAVALKILDGKCKMLPGEKRAVMAVYDVVKNRPGNLFETDVHTAIENARQIPDADNLAIIHHLRVRAEAEIPKPVMKSYKAMLRTGLFG